MSDPAVDAARRAVGLSDPFWAVDSRYGAVAAREALKSIRELHTPIWENCINACCSGEQCKHRSRLCGHCWDEWPCETAKRAYPTEELCPTTGG